MTEAAVVEMRITVHVQPKARWRGAELADDGTLWVRVSVSPERGKANEAVCDLRAKVLGVSKAEVSVVSGYRSRLKTVEVRLDVKMVAERVAGQG